MIVPDRTQFAELAGQANLVPLHRRLFSDQLTPVLGYRRLVSADERTAPSFLFESVEGGASVGRHSFIGARPVLEIVARGRDVQIIDHRTGRTSREERDDPLALMRELSSPWSLAPEPIISGAAVPAFLGGWVGYAGYDTVRYLEPEKLPIDHAPTDDRGLPDLHFGLYRKVGIFDHVDKVLHAVVHVAIDEHESVDAAYDAGRRELDQFVQQLETHSVPLPAGSVELNPAERSTGELSGNFSRPDFERAVEQCREYIAAGDSFQIVISQRFERQTAADPFEIYRALRIVNPSPYMIYLQASGSILVASSPEILCRCQGGVVTSRPLAGTRRRGMNPRDDQLLEQDLLSDEKETAEHVMLVDLGRNDLGKVCRIGSISLEKVMDVERYSHVMHLSSTVTGRLRDDCDAWDALRETLPVGTVSGAPKIRAMQIIDELEPTRRGPYAGGIGFVGFDGNMDMALALRTMVIPTARWDGSTWAVHLQAGAGIVADSVPAREYEETVNKAAALSRAIDLAECAFSKE